MAKPVRSGNYDRKERGIGGVASEILDGHGNVKPLTVALHK